MSSLAQPQLWQCCVRDVTSHNPREVTPGHLWLQMHFIRLMPLLLLATSSSNFLIVMPSSEFPTRDLPLPEGLEGKISLCKSDHSATAVKKPQSFLCFQ